MRQNVLLPFGFESQNLHLNLNLHLNSALPKMSRFFKNCGHLSKATAGNLLSFLIIEIIITLIEKSVLVSG